MSVLIAGWQNQTEYLPIFSLHIYYTALPLIKRFCISNIQSRSGEQKAGNVFQNTDLKTPRQELVNTANGSFPDLTAPGIPGQKHALGFSTEMSSLNQALKPACIKVLSLSL